MTPHPEYDGDEARLPLEWVLCCSLVWVDDGLGTRWQMPDRYWVEDAGGNVIRSAADVPSEYKAKLLEFVASKSVQEGRR